MRACGSEKAVLFGYSEGGPMSILFAATYPRTGHVGSGPGRVLRAASCARPIIPGGGIEAEMVSDRWSAWAARAGEQGAYLDVVGPERRRRPAVPVAPSRHYERFAASPGAALQRMMRMITAIDVRHVLPAIGVPDARDPSPGDRVTPSSIRAGTSVEHLPGRRTSSSPAAITCRGWATPTRYRRRSRSS